MTTPNCSSLTPLSDATTHPSRSHHPSQIVIWADTSRHWLTQCWRGFSQWLATRDEPQISERFDRQGRSTGWKVFDPQTGHTLYFSSNLEVRFWLEQRFR